MVLNLISERFWNPKLWLPPGIGWDFFLTDKTVKYRRFEDLYTYPLPLAVIFILVRFFIERFVFQKIGEAYGLSRERKTTVPKNEFLEEHYQKKSSLEVVLKKCDLPKSQVASWLRKRKRMDTPSNMYKFRESCWRSLCYTFLIGIGIWAVYGEPFLRDVNECWYTYPRHEITPGIWWHYMLETGFYLSLLMTQAYDTKRKDAKQMCLHHLATLVALVSSWANNMIRMGTLVLLLHDIADPFLEFAKLFRYLKFFRVCEFFFRSFAVVFFITRLIIFPGFLLKSSMYDVVFILPWFDVYWIINSMLVVLLCLHAFWAYLIYKVAVKAHKSGKVDDSRSSSESGEDSS